MKIKLIVLFLILSNYCISQKIYTASLFYGTNKSLAAELIKKRKNTTYGIGMSTFFNRGAKGQDYTNIYDPAFAYEIIQNFNGTLYGIVAKSIDDVTAGVRIGMGARKFFYNGNTNGLEWYVVRDAGSYLLYGGFTNVKIRDFRLTLSYDNINKLSIGLGINFNEYK
jgi:hypothetical protein